MEIRARTVQTSRLAMQVYETGDSDAVPVVLVHGNLATGRFFDEVLKNAPAGYRMIAPDMRGFGRTERVPIDATRGLRDWADDTAALVSALEIDRPIHLVGWSTGGSAIACYAIDRPGAVASLTFIDPVSPYGYGGTKDTAGTPNDPDFAGTGGGAGNQDFAQRIANGDRSTESDLSPLNVMRTFYWSPEVTIDPEWEQVLLDEVLLSEIGDDGYPGDSTTSPHWPGFAPGTRGILNALSGKYCNWSAIVDLDPKPPVLWTHGSKDMVVADASPWEMGTLGQLGAIPEWPGADAYPPQPMVSQIRAVLERYEQAGGHVVTEMFEESAHGPHIDASERWRALFYDFLSR